MMKCDLLDTDNYKDSPNLLLYSNMYLAKLQYNSSLNFSPNKIIFVSIWYNKVI